MCYAPQTHGAAQCVDVWAKLNIPIVYIHPQSLCQFEPKMAQAILFFAPKLQILGTACPEIVQKQQQLRVAGTKQEEGVPLA